jgi:hypothetical protein
MRSTTARWVWPLLGIIIILFVVKVRAPRDWRRVAIAPFSQLVTEAALFPPPVHLADLGLDEWPTPLTSSINIPDLVRPHLAAAEKDGVLSASRLSVHRGWQGAAGASLSTSGLGDRDVRAVSGPDPPFSLFAESTEAPTEFLSDLAVGPQVAEIAGIVARRYSDQPDYSDSVGRGEEGEIGLWNGLSALRMRVATTGRWPPNEYPANRQWVYRRTSDSTRERLTTWPQCPALLSQLDQLKQNPAATRWCGEVQMALESLRQFDKLPNVAANDVLAELDKLADAGHARSGTIQDSLARNQWGRCVHALQRRLAIWRRIHETTPNKASPVTITIRDTLDLAPVLDAVETRLAAVKNGEAWRIYLCVEEARLVADPATELDTAAVRVLARRILERMDYSRLTPEQRNFLLHPSLLDYAQEMKHLAADPVDYHALLNDLEDYELSRRSETAARIASAQQTLRWSHDEAVMRLGQELDGRYRNANLRVAISRELMNRWMPPAEPAQIPIDERIMGVRTRGSSATVARLQLRLLPSLDSWNFYLHADGEVASRTYASQGPATFFTRGRSVFQAEKQIVIRPEGVQQQDAEVAANSNTNLAGLRTDVDPIPILGNVAQAIAARQYQVRAPWAEREARSRLAWRVGETIDQQVREQIQQAEKRFTDHFQRPMQQLGVDPMPLEMQTTEDRVIARYRLAGPHQLAAYTPRPLAPGNSLMSLQIHESALNNVVDQLGWSGRRVPLKDIYDELSTLFAAPRIEPPSDLPDDVIVRFADRNPVRITFQDGRVTLTMGLAELSQGRNRWRNFVVRVHYQPAMDDPDADLVRDQYVELIGRLALRDQIALRGVFSRVFSREKPFNLISRRLAEEPRLEGLEISQMEIADGWFALAIGPAGTRLAMTAHDERHRATGSLIR